MTISRALYTAGLALTEGVLTLAARGEGKLARGVRGMRASVGHLEEWAFAHRDEARPLVWFHAPSVGEGFQARAVIERLRIHRTDLQIVYTYFSPSAEDFARTVPADYAGYLPPDLPPTVSRALSAVRPDVIVFSKTEVWPNLTREASRRGIPTLLLSATLPHASSRLRPPARHLLRETHALLAMVGAISGPDAERYAALGVAGQRRVVMGDARFDQVWLRANSVNRDGPLLRPLRMDGIPCLVAGSTWPPDEDRLIQALDTLRRSGTKVRLIIAPHEPSKAAIGRLSAAMDRLGIPHRRLSAVAANLDPLEVIVVDRMGVLGDLYGLADVAYVGGGFGTAGLHSVLEPAAFGVPVIFGPRHGNAREAGELIRAGAAAAVTDVTALTDRLGAWLSHPAAAGAAAAGYVQAGRGAADRGARMILEFLPG